MTTEVTNTAMLVVDADPSRPGRTTVSVRQLHPDLVTSLISNAEWVHRLGSIFRVTVNQPESQEAGSVPAMLGRYELLDDGVRFIPRFPFEPGVQYLAAFNPRPLGIPSLSEVLTLGFSIPRERNAEPPEVTHVFPSADVLPENLLRFYVCFSSSMRRGRAEEQIELLDPDGRAVRDVLYRPPVELWDRQMKRLTVLLDPGRLKRRVGPNRRLGPPLRAGRHYTLRIGSGMLDRDGEPLWKPFLKHFRATEPVREPIAAEQWRVSPPSAGSRLPLGITCPKPLDWALFSQVLTIESPSGTPVSGRVDLGHAETHWSFTPKIPWAAGRHCVRVGSNLEDVCGNSLTAAFDRALRDEAQLVEAPAGLALHFEV